MEYEELVQLYQEKKIDDLHFLLEQKELTHEYLEDMKKRNETPNNENARQWLREFETITFTKTNLYERQ